MDELGSRPEVNPHRAGARCYSQNCAATVAHATTLLDRRLPVGLPEATDGLTWKSSQQWGVGTQVAAV